MTLCRFTIGQPTLKLVTTAPTIAQGVTMVEVEAAGRGAVAQGTDEMADEAAVNGDENLIMFVHSTCSFRARCSWANLVNKLANDRSQLLSAPAPPRCV